MPSLLRVLAFLTLAASVPGVHAHGGGWMATAATMTGRTVATTATGDRLRRASHRCP